MNFVQAVQENKVFQVRPEHLAGLGDLVPQDRRVRLAGQDHPERLDHREGLEVWAGQAHLVLLDLQVRR